MEYEQFQDSGSLAKLWGEPGTKLYPGAAVLLKRSLEALLANPLEALAWRRAAFLLASTAEYAWQPRPHLRPSPLP